MSGTGRGVRGYGMMHHDERAKMARMCRGQAALASNEGVRTTLIELAELYEAKETDALVPDVVEPLPQQPE